MEYAMERLFRSIEDETQKHIDFLCQICNYEARAYDKQTIDSMLDYITAFALGEGFRVNRTPMQTCGDFLSVELNEQGEKGCVFLAHTDTVHEKGVFGPIPVTRLEDRIIAPGSIDCKGGIAIALVLLVLLGVGFVRLQTAQAEAKALEDYVVSLQEKNDRLYAEYSAGYDLAEIEKIALAMGMVPSSQVPHISMDVTVPQQEAEPTAWENFCAFLTGLFA